MDAHNEVLGRGQLDRLIGRWEVSLRESPPPPSAPQGAIIHCLLRLNGKPRGQWWKDLANCLGTMNWLISYAHTDRDSDLATASAVCFAGRQSGGGGGQSVDVEPTSIPPAPETVS